MYGADSHLLKKGVVCDLWVGLWIGSVIFIVTPADDRAICSDGTSVLVSGRDQIGWRDVIERRSLALCTGGCAGKPDRKHHKKWQTASQHAADMKGGEAYHDKHPSCGDFVFCIEWLIIQPRCDDQMLAGTLGGA